MPPIFCRWSQIFLCMISICLSSSCGCHLSHERHASQAAVQHRCARRAVGAHLDAPLLQLNFARVHVTRILELGNLRLCRYTIVHLRVPLLERQLLLELLIVILELFNRCPAQTMVDGSDRGCGGKSRARRQAGCIVKRTRQTHAATAQAHLWLRSTSCDSALRALASESARREVRSRLVISPPMSPIVWVIC